PLRRRGLSRQPASIGPHDRRRPPVAEDGAGAAAHLRSDARAQVGDFDGRLRIDWWRLRQLRAGPGRGSGGSGRCVRARLPAQARIAHLWHRAASAKDRPAEARVMESTALRALLQGILPGVSVETAPSVDLQPAIYVRAEDLVSVLQTLRDHEELDFKLLVELTAVDYLPREPRFEVVYILVSIARRQRLRVKVRLA